MRSQSNSCKCLDCKCQEDTRGLLAEGCTCDSCACLSNAPEGDFSTSPINITRRISVGVTGMTCTGCETTIVAAIQPIEGVVLVKSSFSLNLAVVSLADDVVDLEQLEGQIVASLDDFGYMGVILSEVCLDISGPTCSSCTNIINSMVSGIEGVRTVYTTLEKCAVIFSEPAELSQFIEEIQDVGYGAALCSHEIPCIDASLLIPQEREAEGSSSSASSESPSDSDRVSQVLEFDIEGMRCASCVASIEKEICRLPGVSAANVSLLSKRMRVAARQDVHPEQIERCVEKGGYSARSVGSRGGSALKLRVGGDAVVYEGDCEEPLELLPGVQQARYSHETRTVTIIYQDAASRRPRAAIAALEEALSCPVSVASHDEETLSRLKMEAEVSSAKTSFLAALCFLIPAFALMVMNWIPAGHHILSTRIHNEFNIHALTQFLIAVPVQFILGLPFHKGAVNAILRKKTTMDTLVSLGTFVAFAYSFSAMLLMLLRPNYRSPLFFDASVMLISFILGGRYLEALTKGSTSSAISSLLEFRARFCTLVLEDGTERHIDPELLQEGDILRVGTGDKVACDGVIIEGTSLVDEAMLTGESKPVRKRPGDHVMGGTINCGGGILRMEAERVGSDTALSKIVALVEEAQGSKAPIQRFADRIASIFVPTVLLISAFTFILWIILGTSVLDASYLPPDFSAFTFSLLYSVSVLVIACPCALGLATPTAVMVGTGLGAQNGVLIKGGAVLEAAHGVTHVILDKTGTLTLGKPSVSEAHLVDSSRAALMWRLVYAAETGSTHPLGAALLERGIASEDVATEIQSVPGQGLMCVWRGQPACVGNRLLMNTCNVALDTESEFAAQRWENEGGTALFVSFAGDLLGVVSVSDELRPEASFVVAALKRMNIQVIMMSGDNKRTAHSVAGLTGIDTVFAEVLPEFKQSKVKELQATGACVAMVGDGVNDSPALVQADVGIGMGAGTDIAIDSADAVLMRDDLTGVLLVIDISRKTFRRIKLNFVWALLYNSLAIPIAAGALYPVIRPAVMPPAVAGLAMALSSVTVVCSSLLLKLYKPPAQSVDHFGTPIEMI